MHARNLTHTSAAGEVMACNRKGGQRRTDCHAAAHLRPRPYGHSFMHLQSYKRNVLVFAYPIAVHVALCLWVGGCLQQRALAEWST